MTSRTRKRVHLALAVFFAIQVPIALMTPLQHSVPYLVFLSLYAVVGTHLAGASAELPTENDE